MFCWRYWPFQSRVTLAVLTGPPVAVRSSSPTVPRAARAAATSAAVAFHAMRCRGLPAEGQREGAAGAAVDADRLGLGRLHVVVGREAARVPAAGGRVVAGDEPQVVVLVEVDVTADVAARAPVVGDLEDLLLRGQVERWRRAVDELEPRQLEVAEPGVPGGQVCRCGGRASGGGGDRAGDAVRLLHGDGGRCVEQVDPVVRREVVVDRGAVEPVLAVRVDGDRRDDLLGPERRVVQPDLAAAGGLDDPAVGELVEADGLVQVRGRADLGLLEVGQDRRAAVAVDAVRDTGRPLHCPGDVVGEGRLGADRGGAAGGVERPAAPVVLAPGDRVVGAHGAVDPAQRGAGELLGEGLHDDRGQHVARSADVVGEVVPGVGAGPVLRQVLGRDVAAVRHLDGAGLHGGPAGRRGCRAARSGTASPARSRSPSPGRGSHHRRGSRSRTRPAGRP